MLPVLTSALSVGALSLALIALGLTLRLRRSTREALAKLAEEAARRGESDSVAEEPSSARPRPRGSRPRGRRPRGAAASPAGPTLIAVPNLAPPASGAVAMPDELARRFAAIWDLADSGAPPGAIARAIGQPVGQVELILGLRRTRTAVPRA